jgi:uncharacterized protein YndB with AHSA1/START domain
MSTLKKAPIVFDRTYDAPLEDVWDLWVTKDGFESWWGPEGFRVEVHELNATVGGVLFYDMIASGAEQVAHMKAANMPLSHETRGIFTEVEPLKRLVLRHLIDFIPGLDPYENFMRVDFSHSPSGTRMLLSVDAHATEDWTKAATEGMSSQRKPPPPSPRVAGNTFDVNVTDRQAEASSAAKTTLSRHVKRGDAVSVMGRT